MNQTNGSEAILHCRRLHKVYHTGDEDLEVLRDLDLDVWENEFTAITGESGCVGTPTTSGCWRPERGPSSSAAS